MSARDPNLKVITTLRVRWSLLDKMDEIAKSLHTTRSAVIRMALEAYVPGTAMLVERVEKLEREVKDLRRTP